MGHVTAKVFKKHKKGHRKGTIIRFEGVKDGVQRSFSFLRKIIALYFRFSLIDNDFHIYLNGKKVTHADLSDLAESTEFLWTIGTIKDPYVRDLAKTFRNEPEDHETKKLTVSGVAGFIASVRRPRDLKVMTTEERVGVDLFVNGRMRERDILSHIPTARIVENYLYGQIHFNALDDATDRFTSSREGIVADDPKYQTFLGSV